MKLSLVGVYILLTAAILSCTGCSPSPQQQFASGMLNALPEGWEMQTVSQPGMMGHPHGLDEPLFRADFVNPHQQFKAYSADRLANPRVRLCFYDIKDQERIKAIIKTEEIYSWDIPVYFAETTDYLVITSPTYINGGNYTAEATALYEPLGAALKAYFNSKR